MERKNAWKAYSDEQITELEEVNKSYREFLTVGKTERECVKEIIKQAEATGYQSLRPLWNRDVLCKKVIKFMQYA